MPPTPRKATLSKEDKALLKAIKNGADIYSYTEAKRLRELEKLGLVTITKPMMYQGSGADRMPYFGAISRASQGVVGYFEND